MEKLITLLVENYPDQKPKPNYLCLGLFSIKLEFDVLVLENVPLIVVIVKQPQKEICARVKPKLSDSVKFFQQADTVSFPNWFRSAAPENCWKVHFPKIVLLDGVICCQFFRFVQCPVQCTFPSLRWPALVLQIAFRFEHCWYTPGRNFSEIRRYFSKIAGNSADTAFDLLRIADAPLS